MDAATQASGHHRGVDRGLYDPDGAGGDAKILRDVWPRECAWGQLDEVLGGRFVGLKAGVAEQ